MNYGIMKPKGGIVMKEMYDYFRSYMKNEKQYFVNNADFERFYDKTENPRLRNVFLMYILTDQRLFSRFVEKTKIDPKAAALFEDLFIALNLAKRNQRTKDFARFLLQKFFMPYQFILKKNRISAQQIRKYIETFVTDYWLSKLPISKETEQRLKEVDFRSLV